MDNPNAHESRALPLSPCNSTNTTTIRRSSSSSSDSNSPEFEFWMVRNPSFPQPKLLSADELFVDGVLLPLDHLLSYKPSDDPPPDDPNHHPDLTKPSNNEPGDQVEAEAEAGPELRHVTAELTNGLPSSKRWKDIFKKVDKKGSNKNVEDDNKEKEKEKRREKKSQSGSGSTSSAELNINIWPFSRSRSAGNSGSRPRMVSGAPCGTRKVSSAPCSRSNSAGESKSRKWPSSPGRAGVHLGRTSPIWQVKRSGGAGGEKMGSKREGRSNNNNNNNKARVLNLNVNVPLCIGYSYSYRHQLSCRGDGVSSNKNISSSSSNNGGNNNLFNLRSLFTKKVY